MICQAPFFPNRGNYTTDREHDGNQRKSWFLILRTGLFTKKVDAEFQAQTSGSPVLTFRTRAEAEAHWAANCREFHLHGRDNNNEEGSEEEGNDSSLPPSPPPSPTPATSTPRSTMCALHPGQGRALRQAQGGARGPALPGRQRHLTAESPVQAPNASEPVVVAQTQHIPKRALSVAAHARTRRLPQPRLPSLNWHEHGLDLLGIEPVGVRAFERILRRTSPSLPPGASALLQTGCALPSRRRVGNRRHRQLGKHGRRQLGKHGHKQLGKRGRRQLGKHGHKQLGKRGHGRAVASPC
ncbi:hypothetical protein DFH09DRAFT_1322236 [Mycena vulgaris]|nr:hypothetical protein DFH09DRAFT_1322236 [Mycena vulgaris]